MLFRSPVFAIVRHDIDIEGLAELDGKPQGFVEAHFLVGTRRTARACGANLPSNLRLLLEAIGEQDGAQDQDKTEQQSDEPTVHHGYHASSGCAKHQQPTPKPDGRVVSFLRHPRAATNSLLARMLRC